MGHASAVGLKPIVGEGRGLRPASRARLAAFLVLSDLLKPGILARQKGNTDADPSCRSGGRGLIRFRAGGTLNRGMAVGGQRGGEGAQNINSPHSS